MSGNVTTASGISAENIPLMENEHIKQLFSILQENGKDTSGLSALINHVAGMEDFVKQAEIKIVDMKAQLESMKEVQDHPIKTALQNTIKALDTKVAEIKTHISELKTNIALGCKNAVSDFKEKGANVLDKLASFFKVKNGLQAIKNNTVKGVDNCDKAVIRVETFSKEYHRAGLGLKNMARLAIGRKPVDVQKESGKLMRAVIAPYKAEKACLIGIRKQVDKMVSTLDKLEQNAENKRDERAATAKPKKPTLMERLEEKKKEIKERELEMPKKERVIGKAGLEV